MSFSTIIRAEPERVYNAIATAEGLDKWFTDGAYVDAQPGGEIIFRWKDWGAENYTSENGGPVHAATRNEHFIFQWKTDDRRRLTTVEIKIVQVEKGTLIHLTEYGFKNYLGFIQQMLNRASGWAQALTLMKFYVEHGVTY